ncbi:MAG: hypothetical protein ORN23_05570 [Chthoniobacterales bacterium]|nr:hypothetical protein [Chthoniobacterales bacterium]
MKVHIRQIPEGGTLHLEGEQDSSSLGLEEAGAEPIGSLEYSLDVGLSEGGLFATGSVAQKVKMTCVSCLEPFEREIVIEPFATQIELDGNELVDLTREVREDIHLLLPAHPRCDQGGEKTCPARFPASARTAPLPMEKAARPAIWEALDQLKTPRSDGST